MGYSDRYPKRAARRDASRPLLQQATVEDLQWRLQTNEAGIDQFTGVSTPQILVPVAERDRLVMKSNYQYHLDEQAVPIRREAMQDEAWLLKELHKEKLEEVYNPDDQDFFDSLNGITYIVPARGRKMLPFTLAERFRHKRSHIDRQAIYERRMGGVSGREKDIIMDFTDFAREVKYFDKYEIDPGKRKVHF